ncbi:acyltransferase [Mucilaginibacter sp. PAMB04168]|uniref:acyltransferase family protein n=1 Tax=Mucilaginibacter sp. PAMB04168 TaxID=3138567 RepID=UPI0031F702D1
MIQQNIPSGKLKYLFSEVQSLPSILNQRYIPSLDGLRAISIILVILSHLPYPVFEKYSIGLYGVNVFFIISGFLITTLLLKEKAVHGKVSLQRFYIRRFLRILPVAYLFILVLIFLNRAFNMHLAAADFLRPFFFVENFGDHSSFTPAGHYWSLSVEEQFYLMFPFILNRSLKLYIITGLIVIGMTPAIVYVYFHWHPASVWLSAPLYVVYHLLGHGISTILIGSLLSVAVAKYPQYFTFKFKFIEATQIALIVLSWIFFRVKLLLPISLTAVCIALVLVTTIADNNSRINRLLNLKGIKYIGTLSFSLYIWQQIFTKQQPWGNAFPFSNSVALNLVFLTIIALCSYHLYEQRFLKLKSRFNRLSSGTSKKDMHIEVSNIREIAIQGA